MAGRSVQGKIRYIKPEWRDREDAPAIGSRETRRDNTAYYPMDIWDARDADHELGLEICGFMVTEHSTTTACNDDERLRHEYRPEMADLIKRVSGADQTHVLGHLVRTEDTSNFNTAYSRFAHCDYHVGALADMSVSLLQRRHIEPDRSWTFAWYNTWQPFDNDVSQDHLTMCDVRTVDDGDIIEYRYTGYEGMNAAVNAPVFNPGHRWYYYPDLRTDEVLVTKQLDPRPGRVSQTPHTSFLDDTASPDAPPRRSIETRILAVFENT